MRTLYELGDRLELEDDWLTNEIDESIDDLLFFGEDLNNEGEADFLKTSRRKRAQSNLRRQINPRSRKKLASKSNVYKSKLASFEPSVSRVFEEFGYLSDKFPIKHNDRLKKVANEIIDFNIKTVTIVGHAFGSTMERAYSLGFRRALNTALKLKQFIQKKENKIMQFPQMLIASFGDTVPRMGTTAKQDRRVEIVYKRLYT